MKVCGFSFVRNGVKFDYPFREALLSILPLCDEIIVAVGESEDETLVAVQSLHPRIRVIETVWDENLKEGGRVFADETDKAFRAIPPEFDWAFYIQGDEVLHEQYIPVVKRAMEDNLHNPKVDGLLFNYLHFFGSYDYVGTKHSRYRREIRIVRNRKDIFSFRDAQGFRKGDNQKLDVKQIDAWIYHYGWVRDPGAQHRKLVSSETLYHGGEVDKEIHEGRVYDYDKAEEPVTCFDGTHPAVMKERIKLHDWPFNPDPNFKYTSRKDWFKRKIAAWTGWMPFEYQNYRLIK